MSGDERKEKRIRISDLDISGGAADKAGFYSGAEMTDADRNPHDAGRVPRGNVWCTECRTQLLNDRSIIKRHLEDAHGLGATRSMIKAVQRTIDRIVRDEPTGENTDADDAHEKRWSRIIQGGAAGSIRK